MWSDARIVAVRSRRGWLYRCRACARGFMGAGPMQLHLMGSAHRSTLAEVQNELTQARAELLRSQEG
jgi:hypothetical protein